MTPIKINSLNILVEEISGISGSGNLARKIRETMGRYYGVGAKNIVVESFPYRYMEGSNTIHTYVKVSYSPVIAIHLVNGEIGKVWIYKDTPLRKNNEFLVNIKKFCG